MYFKTLLAKLGLLSLSLIVLLSEAHSFSGWDNANSPFHFGTKNYETTFSFKTNEKGLSLDGGLNLSGELTETPQENSKATFAPKINSFFQQIDWQCRSEEISQKIRCRNFIVFYI